MAKVHFYRNMESEESLGLTIEVDANTPDDAQAWLDWLNGLSGDDSAANKSEEKPKRKRRTKAEIEAEKQAANDAGAENQDSDAEKQSEPEPAKAPEITRKDVEKAMQQLMDLSGADPLLKILSALGAEDEQGRAKLSCLDEAKYGEAIEKLNAAAEEAKAKSSQAEGVLG